MSTPLPVGRARVVDHHPEKWTDLTLLKVPEDCDLDTYVETTFRPETFGNAEIYPADVAVFPDGDAVVRQKGELHFDD